MGSASSMFVTNAINTFDVLMREDISGLKYVF